MTQSTALNGNGLAIRIIGIVLSIILIFNGFVIYEVRTAQSEIRNHISDPTIHHAAVGRMCERLETLLESVRDLKEEIRDLKRRLEEKK